MISDSMDFSGTLLGNIRFQARVLAGATLTTWKLWCQVAGKALPAPQEVDLILEGFPRSGNTFLEHMMRIMCPRLRWISHTHARGTIIWGTYYRIPVLLVFRDPLKAAASLFIYHRGSVALRFCLERWMLFHRQALQYPFLALINFDDLTKDTESTIRSGLKELPKMENFIDCELPQNPFESFKNSHDHDMLHLSEVRGIRFEKEQANTPDPSRDKAKEMLLTSAAWRDLEHIVDESRALHARLVLLSSKD